MPSNIIIYSISYFVKSFSLKNIKILKSQENRQTKGDCIKLQPPNSMNISRADESHPLQPNGIYAKYRRGWRPRHPVSVPFCEKGRMTAHMTDFLQKNTASQKTCRDVELLMRLERTTCSLRVSCSTN